MLRYIPDFILQQYEKKLLSGSLMGYALFFDIADFTPIGTQLQKHGKEGAEELSKFLDFVFGEPIRIVERYGGFVSHFAGDAFCAIFPEASGLGIMAAVSAIREFFADKQEYHSTIGDFALKVRQTVSYGEIHRQIYDNPTQSEYVFYGDPLSEMAELSARKEDCIFSAEAARKLGLEHFESIDKGYRLLQEPIASESEPVSISYNHNPETYSHFIQQRLISQKPDNEIRSAAFCFASLEAIPREERNVAVDKLAALSHNYGAYINKLDATDKGLTALILFGLPRSEGKTLERICSFALEALNQVPQLAMGLAKGNVYAGYTGSSEVREYTALGHPLNLAARLMSIAPSGEIITDSYLCQEMGELFVFEVKVVVTLKGINEAIMSYRLKEQAGERKLAAQPYFVGRDKELAELRQSLNEAISTNNNLAVYIYGDPGIGKSRLIRELLDIYPEDSYHRFFIYCDAILPKSLEPIKQLLRQYFPADPLHGQQDRIAAYRANWKLLAGNDAELIRIESILASLLGYEWDRSIWEMLPPPERPKQLKNAYLRFISELAQEKPVLLHLDDGQWIDEMSKDYLQALSDMEIKPVQIISSCRYLDDGSRPELGLSKHTTIQTDLGILDEEGSRELIRNILKRDELLQHTFEEINARASGNPFFIEQLCAYLVEIDKIDDKGRITGELGSVASFSISDIIGSRIDRLTERVRDCVYNASVLGMEFNVQVLSHMLNDTLINEMEIGKANLIWKDLDELRYIFSHILIKDIAYLRILGSRLKTLHQIAAEAMEIVFKDALDEHAEEIGIHFEKAGIEEKAADYFDKAGCWFSKIYDFEKSYYLLNKALQIREQLLGAEHPDTTTSLNNLAILYGNQGKNAEAELLYVRALAIREKVLGAEHPHTVTSLDNIATLYWHQGKYAEAEPLYLRGLAIWEKVLGAEHPITAHSLNGLASLYDDQGKYAQAEPLYLRALAIREKALGAEHPDTAGSLNGLAVLYKNQGKYAESEPLYLRALAIMEKVLGAEHPDTALALSNLANLYGDQGKYAEAEPLYLRALAIREKVMGAEHPDTASSLNNLASWYYKQGKYVEAEPLYLRALAIWEKVLGTEHPHTASSLNNLALLYSDQGKYAEAEPLNLRALAIWEKVLGADHPHTACSLGNLALLYEDQGKYAEAELFYLKTLAVFEKSLGLKHPWTIDAIRGISELYERMDKPDKASHYRAMLPQEEKSSE